MSRPNCQSHVWCIVKKKMLYVFGRVSEGALEHLGDADQNCKVIESLVGFEKTELAFFFFFKWAETGSAYQT